MTRTWLSAAIVAALGFVVAPGLAQTLETTPSPAPAFEMLPRIADSGLGAHERLNAALQRLDEDHLAQADCGDGTLDGASRNIDILSDGGQFLSFSIEVVVDCGGAHPTINTWLVNYYLDSGRRDELFSYLPEDWKGASSSSIPLSILYFQTVSDLPPECVELFTSVIDSGQLRFSLGLDERHRALVIRPNQIPFAYSQCEKDALVPVERLAEAQFSPLLIHALDGTW